MNRSLWPWSVVADGEIQQAGNRLWQEILMRTSNQLLAR
jgi:hypothetical protein